MEAVVIIAVVVGAVLVFSSRFVGGWAAAWPARRVDTSISLSGHTYIVTGGNRGVGERLVALLADAGATVVLCSRSRENGEAAKMRCRSSSRSNVVVMDLDLSCLESIERFATKVLQQFLRVDCLVLNGGVAKSMQDCSGFRTTRHGWEEMMAVNYLGHVHLTNLLLPALRSSLRGRIVAMTSVASANSYPCGVDYASWYARRPDYTDWAQYGQSKLALCLYVEELQRREPALLSVCCHPGVADTGLTHHTGSHIDWLYSKFVYGALGMTLTSAALHAFHCTTAAGLQPGAIYHPFGRLGFKSHWYQRLGALQAPVAVQTSHPELWERTLRAIKTASGK